MIEVIDPGPLTTVQDRGRYGQLRYGIPPSGPMDALAHAVANRLVGNDAAAAALECTLVGMRFAVATGCVFALAGADMPLAINGKAAPAWTALHLSPGDEVKLGSARSGMRGYLAFAGGIAVPTVLGSRSTYVRGRLGGLAGRALRRGDRLALLPADGAGRYLRLRPEAVPSCGGDARLRVVLGPQHERFTRRGIDAFLGGSYAMLPQSDRMGARLRGEAIEHAAGHDIVSDGTALGSVQVPGDGQPIVLLVDRQSTGGYTKLATVCSFDIRHIGQLRPGQAVRFEAIEVAQAHALGAAARAALQALPFEEVSP